MAALLFYLQLLAFFFTNAASQRNSTISPGSVLSPTNNSYWLSESGLYAFGFYPRGNGYSLGVFLAGIPQKTVVWMPRRNDPPVPRNSTLSFTNDGSLILRSSQSGDIIIATPSQTTVSAAMLDTGNFVLYNSVLNTTWESFDYPTDTILEGQVLGNGKELFSSASVDDPSIGIFMIWMQSDGNLVQYPTTAPTTPSTSYWSSDTFSLGDSVALILGSGGLLYLFNGTGYHVKNVSTGGSPQRDFLYRATIDADGIFRVYSYNMAQKGNWSTIWSTTNDSCSPKGLCGLNAFCTNNDQVADCQCIPGFSNVKMGNKTSGCEQNFTASCEGNYPRVNYVIQAVPQTEWEDNSYSVIQSPTEETCRTECLQDCNCRAATYGSGLCKKQKLPLRFGRRNLDSSNILFVKVGELAPGSDVPDVPTLQGRRERARMDILAVSISLIALASIMLLVFVVLIHQKRVWAYKMIPKDGASRLIEDVAPKSFTYDELRKVTNDFTEEIGHGAFGTVYKGTMPSGQVVAVKRLGRVSSEGEREFHTELKIIGKTHHRNLVRLLGYSLDGSNRLLVYEYMSNGSLADVLFTQDRQPRWDEKMSIARNIARGLLYLHEECETQIIHCDIKPQNILIDEYGFAKISDFGLSKLLKPDQTNTFTNIRGTRGYVAPEWHKNLPITVKADVYSFGIVLLEIICCRRNVDHSLPEEEAVLEEWVYDCFQSGEMDKLLANEDVDRRQFDRIVKVAIWCILEDPSLRPPMRKVLLMLEGTIETPVPPCPTSFLSAI